jgi:hypothetical protein
MNCSCRKALTRSLVNHAGRASLKDLLKEVSLSGIEHDDERLGYVTVQINRDLWEAIKKELEQ